MGQPHPYLPALLASPRAVPLSLQVGRLLAVCCRLLHSVTGSHRLWLRMAVRHGRHGRQGWARWQHVANAGKYFVSILAVWNMAALKLDNHYDDHNGVRQASTCHSRIPYLCPAGQVEAVAHLCASPNRLADPLRLCMGYPYGLGLGSRLLVPSLLAQSAALPAGPRVLRGDGN